MRLYQSMCSSVIRRGSPPIKSDSEIYLDWQTWGGLVRPHHPLEIDRLGQSRSTKAANVFRAPAGLMEQHRIGTRDGSTPVMINRACYRVSLCLSLTPRSYVMPAANRRSHRLAVARLACCFLGYFFLSFALGHAAGGLGREVPGEEVAHIPVHTR